MIRAHRTRLNPTPEQAAYFRKAVGTTRFVYNWALAEWKRHKEACPDEEYGPMALKKQFNAEKGQAFPWVYDVAKDVAEGAFTSLAAAFKNYYDSKNGKRKGKPVGFPKFKSKKAKRQSFRLNNDKIAVDGPGLRVPKLGWVNMAEALRFEGRIMGAVVSCRAGRWYVSISVEVERQAPVAFAKPSVGVDLGVKTLAVLSDGKQYENQALLRSELNHLRRLNRRLARRRRGSGRWHRAKETLARFHERIANRRADCLHKMTTEIARTYAVVGLEDLNVDGMVRNRRLALPVSDAGFGEIRRQLEYKCAQFGGRVVLVNRFFPSSRLCPACGTVNADLTLADREWTCGCGTIHARDLNAARNIERESLRVMSAPPAVATSGQGRGRGVRPDFRAVPVETSISKCLVSST